MAARGHLNSKSPTIRRILREASELSTSPSPDYTATPLDDDLFEWHFTLRGPPGSDSSSTSPGSSKGPYHDGMYHGRIVLPPTYPLRPPSFRFMTPSGRFETNREICLSISGHHEETWQPAWGLRTALVALRTFMETDAKGQLGGLECNDSTRRTMAHQSRAWKCAACARSNLEIMTECEKEAAKLAPEGGPRKLEETTIPKELKMGWRDEMRPAAATAAGAGPSGAENTSGGDDDGARDEELAEGFVRTSPGPGDDGLVGGSGVVPVVAQAQGSAYPAARPAQGVPQPTDTIPLPPPIRQAAVQLQQRRPLNEGVPGWVDKAIIGVAACLIVMILNMWLKIEISFSYTVGDGL